MPARPAAPLPVPMYVSQHARELVARWIAAQGLLAVAMVVGVADAAMLRELLSMLVRDVRHMGGVLPLTLRTQKVTERLLELLALGGSLQAIEAIDAHRISQGCEDCMLRALAEVPIAGRCDACEARLEREPLRTAACASCEGTGRNVDDTPCPDCEGTGHVYEGSGEPAPAPGDDVIVVDDELVTVEDDDSRPGPARCESAADRFYARLTAVTLPGEAVALWREMEGELAGTDRDAARRALDEHVGRVGRMGRPAQWIDKALSMAAGGAR